MVPGGGALACPARAPPPRAAPDRRMVAGTGRLHLAGDGVLRPVPKGPGVVRGDGIRMAVRAQAQANGFLGALVVERPAAALVGIARRIRAAGPGKTAAAGQRPEGRSLESEGRRPARTRA